MMFCSDGDPVAYQMINTKWTYSETVEFSNKLHTKISKIVDGVRDIDDPIALIATILIRNMR